MNSKFSFLFIACIFLLAAGCGGGGSSSSTVTPPPPSGGGGGGSTSSPVNPPVVVNLAGGQSATGVDIAVASPAASSPINAELLGVAALGAGGTAFNSGDTIHRGSSMKVILFGTGLNGNLKVTISGPQDIAIANVRSIQSTDNTPGVAFDVVVGANAALGARDVILQDTTNNDITTFTGGLEVIP